MLLFIIYNIVQVHVVDFSVAPAFKSSCVCSLNPLQMSSNLVRIISLDSSWKTSWIFEPFRADTSKYCMAEWLNTGSELKHYFHAIRFCKIFCKFEIHNSIWNQVTFITCQRIRSDCHSKWDNLPTNTMGAFFGPWLLISSTHFCTFWKEVLSSSANVTMNPWAPR